MPSGPVILNNTPSLFSVPPFLVAFWVLGRFDLLRSLYHEVLIPYAVLMEFLAVETQPRRQALHQAPWIVTAELKNIHAASIYAGLDRGESEVLALEREARLSIIDERRGRSFARRMQLPFTGTLGVLVAAKRRRLIVEARPLIETLQSAGFYFHPSLIFEALTSVAEKS